MGSGIIAGLSRTAAKLIRGVLLELTVVDLDQNIGHLELKGRLDPQGTKAVDGRFRNETALRNRPVIVDMSGVTFITSLGIGLLIDCATTVKRNGFDFILVQPSGHVHQVLRKTGIYKIIPSAESVSDAVALIESSTDN